MNKPEQITTVVVNRLQPEVYLMLEKKLSRPLVTEATTPLTAGFALGVEAVLKELRNGFVVSQS